MSDRPKQPGQSGISKNHLHAGGDFFFDTGPSFFSGLSDPETLACQSGKCWDLGEIVVTFFFESKRHVVYCSLLFCFL